MSGAYVYRFFLLLLFGVCLIGLWIDYQQVPTLSSVVLDAKPIETKSMPEKQFQLASLVELSEVTTRPLFIDGREVKSEVEVSSANDNLRTSASRFPMVVTGMVWDGETYMAIFRDTESKEEQTLYLGSELPGKYVEWRLEELDGMQVVIKKNSDKNDESRNDKMDSINKSSTKYLPLVEEGAHYTIEDPPQNTTPQPSRR